MEEKIFESIYLARHDPEIRDAADTENFNLALWVMEKARLAEFLRQSIEELKTHPESEKTFRQILELVKNAFVNKEIKSSSDIDVADFCDAVEILADTARANLVFLGYARIAMLTLDLLMAYAHNLRYGVYFKVTEEGADYE